MKLTVAILMIAVGLATSSIAAVGENADVQGFIRYADTCQHVAGEWDSELAESDRKRIQRSVMKYCGGAQAQSKALKKKYKNSPEVLRTIAAHENDSVTSYVREAGITAPSLVGHYSNQVWSDGEDPHAVSGYYVSLYKNGGTLFGDIGVAIGSAEPASAKLYDISLDEKEGKISFKADYSRGTEHFKGLPREGRDAKRILTFSGKLKPRALQGEFIEQDGYPPFAKVGKEKSVLRKSKDDFTPSSMEEWTQLHGN